jgi:hypothetical protein
LRERAQDAGAAERQERQHNKCGQQQGQDVAVAHKFSGGYVR